VQRPSIHLHVGPKRHTYKEFRKAQHKDYKFWFANKYEHKNCVVVVAFVDFLQRKRKWKLDERLRALVFRR
jgi:hypothetical protein